MHVFLLFVFSLKWIEESFSAVPALSAKLQDVRDENMRHSQYVTAMENLKHIFTVPESVEKTKQWINEGKLLHTHQVHSGMQYQVQAVSGFQYRLCFCTVFARNH